MFLEHLMLKRTKSRVDVYMHDLKTFSGKQIYDLEDKDVLNTSYSKILTSQDELTYITMHVQMWEILQQEC